MKPGLRRGRRLGPCAWRRRRRLRRLPALLVAALGPQATGFGTALEGSMFPVVLWAPSVGSPWRSVAAGTGSSRVARSASQAICRAASVRVELVACRRSG